MFGESKQKYNINGNNGTKEIKNEKNREEIILLVSPLVRYAISAKALKLLPLHFFLLALHVHITELLLLLFFFSLSLMPSSLQFTSFHTSLLRLRARLSSSSIFLSQFTPC